MGLGTVSWGGDGVGERMWLRKMWAWGNNEAWGENIHWGKDGLG
jgi:hypothetical protein